MIRTFFPFPDQTHRWVQRLRVGAYTLEAFRKEEHVHVLYLLSEKERSLIDNQPFDNAYQTLKKINDAHQIYADDLRIYDDVLGVDSDELVDTCLASHAQCIIYLKDQGICKIVDGLNDHPNEKLLGYVGVKLA